MCESGSINHLGGYPVYGLFSGLSNLPSNLPTWVTENADEYSWFFIAVSLPGAEFSRVIRAEIAEQGGK